MERTTCLCRAVYWTATILWATSAIEAADGLPRAAALLEQISTASSSSADTPDQIRARYEVNRSLASATALMKNGRNEQAIAVLTEALNFGTQTGILDAQTRYLLQVGIGCAEHERNRYDEAIGWLTQAVATAERADGLKSERVADALGYLSNIHFMQGDLDASEKIAAQSLALHRELKGPKHLDCGIPLLSLGGVALKRGDAAAAVAHFSEACDLFDAEETDTVDFAVILKLLAYAQHALPDLPAARASFDQIVAIYEKQYGPDDPQTDEARQSLARIVEQIDNPARALTPEQFAKLEAAHKLYRHVQSLMRDEKYREALPEARRVVASLREVNGGNHRDTAFALIELGKVHAELHDAKSAAVAYREAVDMLAALPTERGGQHHVLALCRLGCEAARLDDADEARRILADALAGCRRLDGKAAAEEFEALGAMIFLEGGDEHYDVMFGFLDRMMQLPPTDRPTVDYVKLLCMATCVCTHKPEWHDRGRRYLDEAQTALHASGNERGPETALLLMIDGGLRLANDDDVCLDSYRESYEIFAEKLGERDPQCLAARLLWAQACVSRGEMAEARTLFEAELRLLKKSPSSDEEQIAGLARMVGAACANLNDLPTAERRYQEAIDLLALIYGPDGDETVAVRGERDHFRSGKMPTVIGSPKPLTISFKIKQDPAERR